MIVTFKATGPITLGDNQGLSGFPLTVEVEQWEARCEVQEDQLFFSPTVDILKGPNPSTISSVPFIRSTGNVKLPFVFSATASFATLDAAYAYFAGKLALVGTKDLLQLQMEIAGTGTSQFNYSGSVLESVTRGQKSNGVRLSIKYVFRCGPLTPLAKTGGS